MADILNGLVFFEADSANVTGTRPTWPENMPARDLNDSGRALQGAVKRWADQICATVTTAGTGSAYTVAYSVAPDGLYNGQRFCVLAHTICAASPTLNINSLGAKTIKKMTSTGVVDIIANDILVNMVLDIVYVTSINQFIWINPPLAGTSSGGGTVTGHTHPISEITGLQPALDAKAPLVNPIFTGTVTVPTAAVLTNTAQAASTSHVYESVTEEQPNAQTVTAYTLVASDAGKIVTLSNAAAITVTINTGVFSQNQRVDFVQLGAGQVTFAGSATRHSRSGFKLAGQYAGATAWFIGANEYVLFGDTIV